MRGLRVLGEKPSKSAGPGRNPRPGWTITTKRARRARGRERGSSRGQTDRNNRSGRRKAVACREVTGPALSGTIHSRGGRIRNEDPLRASAFPGPEARTGNPSVCRGRPAPAGPDGTARGRIRAPGLRGIRRRAEVFAACACGKRRNEKRRSRSPGQAPSSTTRREDENHAWPMQDSLNRENRQARMPDRGGFEWPRPSRDLRIRSRETSGRGGLCHCHSRPFRFDAASGKASSQGQREVPDPACL